MAKAQNKLTLDREDLNEAFMRVLNVCEPEHPYHDDPYPVTLDQIKSTWVQGKSSTWARCGPRSGDNVAFYAADQGYFNKVSAERHLAVLTHEVTHIVHTSRGKGDAGHPKYFWREMAFHAWMVRENLSELEDFFGPIDEEKFIEEIIIDPNNHMVDLRVETLYERRKEMAELMGWHDYEPDC